MQEFQKKKNLLLHIQHTMLTLTKQNETDAFEFSPAFLEGAGKKTGAFNVVMWTREAQWKRGRKTKVKKNKVREWSMRREVGAHFQWVACGDIDLFIRETYNEAFSRCVRMESWKTLDTTGALVLVWNPRKCRKEIFQSSSVLRMLSFYSVDLWNVRV